MRTVLGRRLFERSTRVSPPPKIGGIKPSISTPDNSLAKHNRCIKERIAPHLAPYKIEASSHNAFFAYDKGIELELPKSRRNIPFTILRDSCKCPACVDPYSKQRNFRTSDIPLSIQPKSLKFHDNVLEVRWARDIEGYDASHVSTYTAKELDKINPHHPDSTSGRNRQRQLWNREYLKKRQNWISYNDFMTDGDNFARAMRNLANKGIVFLKDIPDSREEVEKIATRMGPLRNTFYGPTWDVRSVPQAENVAYTNQFLGFHMDLMYMNEPPGYQLLHCLRNSSEGGESLFSDSFLAAQVMRHYNPLFYRLLSDFRIPYQYDHENHIYQNSWPVFEHFCSEETGKEFLSHVNYSPPFQGSLPDMHTDYLAPRMDALRSFAYLISHQKQMFEMKLKPGECVIFENRRVVHARRQFNATGGERWLAGAYVDEDAVLSKFKVLSQKFPEAWQTPGGGEPKNYTQSPEPQGDEAAADSIKAQIAAALEATSSSKATASSSGTINAHSEAAGSADSSVSEEAPKDPRLQ